jgi:hypothetical protein
VADRPLFTNAAAIAGADVIAKSIADSGAVPAVVGKLRLFNGTLVPDVGTDRAALEAAETTLTGYPAGGYDLTDFDGPLFAPGGGAVSTSNLVVVEYASGPAVQIGGYWVEDDNAPTPRVREVFAFDPPRSLGQVGDGFQLAVQLGYGANAS